MAISNTEELSAEQVQMLRTTASRLHDKFKGTFGIETIERFLSESLGDLKGSKITTWLPVLAERFASDRLRALAKIEGKIVDHKPYVLFLCVHNAGRSQMAAGWLEHLAGDQVEIFSGGSNPAGEVNAAAVEAMKEVGIDISGYFPKPWTDEIVRAADVVVTMGCGDACPIFPGKRYEDWQVPDPAGRDVEAVRPIRDELERRVRGLMDSLGVPAAAG